MVIPLLITGIASPNQLMNELDPADLITNTNQVEPAASEPRGEPVKPVRDEQALQIEEIAGQSNASGRNILIPAPLNFHEESQESLKLHSFLVKNENTQNNQEGMIFHQGGNGTQDFGNPHHSSPHVLGAQLVSMATIKLLAHLPCYSYDDWGNCFVTQSLITEMMKPFRGRELVQPRFVRVDQTLKPGYGNTYKYHNCFESRLVGWESNFHYELIHTPRQGWITAGLYILKSITSDGFSFGIQNAKMTKCIAQETTEDNCHLSSRYEDAPEIKMNHHLNHQQGHFTVYGHTFIGSTKLLPSKKALHQDCKSCKERVITIEVHSNGFQNQVNYRHQLYLLVAKDFILDAVVRKIPANEVESFFLQLYSRKELEKMLPKYGLSPDHITAVMTSCVVNVQQIFIRSPFQSAVYVIPNTHKIRQQSYLLTPALLVEMQLRWCLKNTTFTMILNN